MGSCDHQPVLKIAVTGSAGSGKSLVLAALGARGLVILDCDQIARDLVVPGQEGYHGVIRIFGPDVVHADQTLNRARLRNRMMDAPDLRRDLEALLHPLILSEMNHRIETATYGPERACAVEVPLLFESGMDTYFDRVVLVCAEDDGVLAHRIAARDQVPLDRARQILSLQMPQAEKRRRSHYVLENRGTPDALSAETVRLYGVIKKEFLTSCV